MKPKLSNELPRLAFEFFLATYGAEVVCFSFKGYLEFCCFFRQVPRRTHNLSSNNHTFFGGEVQYKIEWPSDAWQMRGMEQFSNI